MACKSYYLGPGLWRFNLQWMLTSGCRFRWVVCQVDTLRRSFPASIRSALNDLPKTLDETYGRTLLGIDEEKREFTQRLLGCLMVSIRPLRVE
jgi:hypothetical protein